MFENKLILLEKKYVSTFIALVYPKVVTLTLLSPQNKVGHVFQTVFQTVAPFVTLCSIF